MRTSAFIITAVILSAPASAAVHPTGRSNVDTAIDRGVAFLAKEALAWKSERKCASCHHAGLVLWALREANQRGHKVDDSALAQITQWVAESGEGKTSVPRPAGAPRALNETAVILALGLGADSKPDLPSQHGLKRLLKTVQTDQIEGGSWSAWPETRQPIFGKTDETVTALATLALIPAAATGDGPAIATRDKGIQWLAKAKTDNDPQTIGLRLIVWRRMDRPPNEWKPLMEDIKKRQNADGGWSQTKDMPSDAWATGQAIYALALAGVKPDDSMLVRAQVFLTRTQNSDGSWPMTSRPIKPGGTGSKNLDPIICAGSAWAVLGLVQSR
jgi:hypothetical protein